MSNSNSNGSGAAARTRASTHFRVNKDSLARMHLLETIRIYNLKVDIDITLITK